MATSFPATPSAQLCDYCHQKPKFSNHSYCSKTCAGQAAALCNHCHKKPKYQNFEYCGKNCAALANPGGKARNAGAGSAPQVAAGNAKASYSSKGSNATNNQPQPAGPAFDPVQIARLVAQHIPQVQALLAPGLNPAGQSVPGYQQPVVSNPFAGPAAQVVPPTNAGHNAGLNNPFLNPPAQNPPMSNGAVTSAAFPSSNSLPAAQPLHISTQQPTDNSDCLIPGCGKPVHVDAKGVKTSDYCSMRHREEAVASGLVSPCIMCLMLPQSDIDYFCSRACREESLNKQLDYYDEASE